MYAVAVISLIVTLQDGIVMWYEALLLVLFYMIYIAGEFPFEIYVTKKNTNNFIYN